MTDILPDVCSLDTGFVEQVARDIVDEINKIHDEGFACIDQNGDIYIPIASINNILVDDQIHEIEQVINQICTLLGQRNGCRFSTNLSKEGIIVHIIRDEDLPLKCGSQNTSLEPEGLYF